MIRGKVLSISIGIFICLLSLFFLSCKDDSKKDKSKLVTISWAANKESAVNRPGGGYKVYYSRSNGFNITDSGVTVLDIPYVSGSLSPTTTSVNLTEGTWYFRIQAYSSLNNGSVSAASEQQGIDISF
jgi:hypothetical protein